MRVLSKLAAILLSACYFTILLATALATPHLHALWQGGATEPDLVHLFGLPVETRPGTELHLIQASTILVLTGLIFLAAKISSQKYVYRWTYAWLSLLCYYVFASLAGLFPGLAYLYGSTFAITLNFTLFFLSTYFVFLAALHLNLPTEISRKNELAIGLILLLLVLTPSAFAPLFGLTERNLINCANAALACVCTIFAGFSLRNYLNITDVAQEPPGGVEVAPIFTAYGLLQIGATWLDEAPWIPLLYASALVLKIPCSLSVVAIALKKTFAESEARRRQLRSKRDDLSKLLTRAKEARIISEARERALDTLESLISQDRNTRSALLHIVETGTAVLDVECGALLLPSPGDDPNAPLLAIHVTKNLQLDQSRITIHATERQEGTAKGPRSSQQNEGRQRQPQKSQLMRVESLRPFLMGKLGMSREPEIFPLSLTGLSADAWLALCIEVGKPQGQNIEILSEVLQRAEAAFELALLREMADMSQALRILPNEGGNITDLLNDLARIGCEKISAAELSIELKDEKSFTKHYGYWSDLDAAGANAHGGQLQDAKEPSPYPTSEKWSWYEFEEDSSDSHASSEARPLYRSIIQVPVNNNRGMTGFMTCVDRRLPETDFLVPFTELDLMKLKLVGDTAAATVERELRRQNIEHLVAQNIHELRQSVSSLRNITRFLFKTLKPSDDTKIWRKLSDAKTDIASLRRIVDWVDIYDDSTEEPAEDVQIFGEIIMKAGAELKDRLQRFGIPHHKQRIEYRHVVIIPKLRAPRSSLQHIILNLANNAFKYRSPGRNTFALEFEGDVVEDTTINDKHGNYYIIRVRDWGIGVPVGWEEQIFSEGVRAPNAVRRSHPGKGMGLPVARLFARKLDGDVRLENRADPTEFAFFLPKRLKA